MTHKRELEIEKSKEEFAIRMMIADWREKEEQAALLRLYMLVQFHPGKTDRQIVNHAKEGIGRWVK